MKFSGRIVRAELLPGPEGKDQVRVDFELSNGIGQGGFSCIKTYRETKAADFHVGATLNVDIEVAQP